MVEIKEQRAVTQLLFGIHVEADNLFSAKVAKIRDGKITEWKKGTATSLGHALNIAESLMSAYAIAAIEKSAEQFYNDIKVV
jgi:hypothetical protein